MVQDMDSMTDAERFLESWPAPELSFNYTKYYTSSIIISFFYVVVNN